MKIAWGQKVSRTFIERLMWIVDDLDIGYGTEDGTNKMMGCIGWETGRTFSPSVINKAGSGATGLIQFMPSTAEKLGTTTSALAKMTAEDQLNYVWKYFAPYKGKLKTLGDIYAAILWPKGVGKPDDYVYWDSKTKPTTYRQNSGIDMNKDGAITKAEATAKVTALYQEGFSEGNVYEYGETVPEAPPETSEPDAKPASDILSDIVRVGLNVPTSAPNIPILQRVEKAAAGWQGNFAGILVIAGSLLLNPDFATKLAGFTIGLAKGEGSWGALAGLIGAALIAYRGSQRT